MRPTKMTDARKNLCLTCHGAGEIATDLGPEICPACQGDERCPGRRELLEWRLRDIERVHSGEGHACEADMKWLVYELRRSRNALLQILSRCQDAEEGPLSSEVKYIVNEALGLYEPT